MAERTIVCRTLKKVQNPQESESGSKVNETIPILFSHQCTNNYPSTGRADRAMQVPARAVEVSPAFS